MSARRILLTEADQFPISDELIQLIAQQGYELKRMDGYAQKDIREAGKECFSILMFHGDIDGGTLDSFQEMRIISRVGTGYEKIDVREANRRGVIVTNVPGAFTDVLADHAMLFILMYARQMPFLLRSRKSYIWPPRQEFPTTGDLGDQTLGIIGFGPSGQALAQRALAFGMGVKAWSRTRKPEIASQLGVEEVSLEEALNCDYVSLHVALTPDTAHMINTESLKHFKKTGVLINIGRGGLVDENALIEALDSDQLRGAGLDVVDPEPLPLSSPLWQHEKVELTFHTAAFTTAGGERCMRAALEEIFRVGNGQDPLNQVKS
jgi:D-3-phosphoglycerate dehydrogenase/(S)-sulfolactate dehydrogenase